MGFKIAFETLGCRLNQAETAVFARQFAERGYGFTEDSAEADLCIVNTCALTDHAASKCRRLIRSIIRRNPDACIAAVGCYAQTDLEELKTIEGLDYIIGTADKMRLPEIILSPVKLGEPMVLRRSTPRGRFTVDAVGYYPTHTRANLKIQEGCSFVCSFCIIPRSRGSARSRDFDDVVKEARALVSEGHRELVITGINVGTYDDRGRSLANLVTTLDTLDGLERIRLSSIEPTTIDPRLVDRMSEETTLCPYLHVPLQSGDDGVLTTMRRKYTAAEYAEFVDGVRSRVPGIGLGTDVMVGFPGEDEAAFERTCAVVERIPFVNVHVFSFSARRGTGAFGLDDQVPGDVIAERSKILHKIADAKKKEFYEKQIGQTLRVLFEERTSTGDYVGFADNYVKMALPNPLELSNRLGLVRVTGVATTGPGSRAPLVAVGDLMDVEDNAVPLAARDIVGG